MLLLSHQGPQSAFWPPLPFRGLFWRHGAERRSSPQDGMRCFPLARRVAAVVLAPCFNRRIPSQLQRQPRLHCCSVGPQACRSTLQHVDLGAGESASGMKLSARPEGSAISPNTCPHFIFWSALWSKETKQLAAFHQPQPKCVPAGRASSDSAVGRTTQGLFYDRPGQLRVWRRRRF